jgi:hypothetical protein
MTEKAVKCGCPPGPRRTHDIGPRARGQRHAYRFQHQTVVRQLGFGTVHRGRPSRLRGFCNLLYGHRTQGCDLLRK